MALTKVSTAVVDLSGNTGALEIAKGTTAERDAITSPTLGLLRANTTDNTMEVYTSTGWQALAEGGNAIVRPLTVDYLVVGGGGGGGGANAGGGAGGLRTSYGSTSGGGSSAESSLNLTVSTNYTVTVGAEGSGGIYLSSVKSTNGASSVFNSITSLGGGAGATYFKNNANGPNSYSTSNPAMGSGGGGNRHASYLQAGGLGTSGQGYAGGTTVVQGNSGGGGGAAAIGQSGFGYGYQSPVGYGGDGGAGLAVQITGTNTYYAGGGGGMAYSTALAGSGGIGGGGDGKLATNNADGGAGTTNLGGGGGASGASAYRGGAGGSGVVILRYPNSYSITKTGSLISSDTTVGSDTVTTFLSGTGTIEFDFEQ